MNSFKNNVCCDCVFKILKIFLYEYYCSDRAFNLYAEISLNYSLIMNGTIHQQEINQFQITPHVRRGYKYYRVLKILSKRKQNQWVMVGISVIFYSRVHPMGSRQVNEFYQTSKVQQNVFFQNETRNMIFCKLDTSITTI